MLLDAVDKSEDHGAEAAPAVPAKRYVLLEKAQMYGALREPGFVFTLAEGEKGPHRTVVASNHGAQIADHMGAEQPSLVDVPLYAEVKDDPATPHNEAEADISPELQAAKDQIRSLEAVIADKDKQLAEAHARLAAAATALA